MVRPDAPDLICHPPLIARVVLVCLCLGFVAGSLGLSAAAAPPESAPLRDGPEDLRRQVLEHRFAEAATKAQLHEGLLRAWLARTPNQNEFDILHYDLDLDLDPGTQTLSGTVTTTAEIVGTSVGTMDFNLRDNMTVSSASSGGLAATFSHLNDILTVDLDRTYVTGETVVVAITYSGNPAGAAFGWDYHGDQEMIWTLSEPYGARDWWPCKDHARDKADSVDIRVTVPEHLIVVSNGELVSNLDNGTTRTFHWRSAYAITTYLVSLAIHPYTTYSDWYTPQGGGDPMEVQFYVYADHFDTVQENYAKTVPMLDVFAQGFGEYPFLDEKYGHAEIEWPGGGGGAMEHQTISSLGGWGEDLISHELAHQWFGDLITCNRFDHIWLNEGFATWAEAYWREQTSDVETYKQYMELATYFGPGTIYVENPSDISEIFNVNLSYNKASWVVHMLRGVLGDADFFAGLALYRATYGYSTATTEQFRDVMETASGQDLDAFFQQWIYGEYFPVYRYEWTPIGGGVSVVIEQIQTNTGLFTMPIDVRVETTTGTFDFVVQNSLALESYELTVSGDVQDVILDPDRWILRQLEPTVTNPTFDEGILLVNGVDWNTYGAEIQSAYANSAFWGDHSISFWDTFSEPAGGYPPNLPAPIGFDAVPPGTIGRFSTVIWVGNHWNGDLLDWIDSPIDSYLEVGGNVLLMSRRGAMILDESQVDRLGITWTEFGVNLGNCTAVYPGLGNIGFTGSQSQNATFSHTVGPNSTVLYADSSGTDRGTGVHSQPPGGGTERPEGGQFIYLAGRPYRMQHLALRTNVEFLLWEFFYEPQSAVGSPLASTAPARLELAANRPNPFRGRTLIPFSLPAAGPIELAIYDLRGRLVRTLVSGPRPLGSQMVSWDGRNGQGDRVASGVYYVRLLEGDHVLSRPVVLLR